MPRNAYWGVPEAFVDDLDSVMGLYRLVYLIKKAILFSSLEQESVAFEVSVGQETHAVWGRLKSEL